MRIFFAVATGWLVLAGSPAQASPTPAPGAGQPSPSAITVSVDDAVTSVGDDGTSTYVISVDSASGKDQPITVRLVLPDGLQDVKATGATVNGTSVVWKPTIKAGQHMKLHLRTAVGTYAEKNRQLTMTACVYLPTSGRAVACGSDVNEVITARRGGAPVWAWIGAVLLTVAGLGGYLFWQRRRTRAAAAG